MLVSILHRATGDGLALAGGIILTWWLYAAASGGACYASFQYYVWKAAEGDVIGFIANIFGRVVLFGLSWAFFQHMLSGLRHFVMDMGAGYELKASRTGSIATIVLSIALTILFWAWLLVGRAL